MKINSYLSVLVPTGMEGVISYHFLRPELRQVFLSRQQANPQSPISNPPLPLSSVEITGKGIRANASEGKTNPSNLQQLEGTDGHNTTAAIPTATMAEQRRAHDRSHDLAKIQKMIELIDACEKKEKNLDEALMDIAKLAGGSPDGLSFNNEDKAGEWLRNRYGYIQHHKNKAKNNDGVYFERLHHLRVVLEDDVSKEELNQESSKYFQDLLSLRQKLIGILAVEKSDVQPANSNGLQIFSSVNSPIIEFSKRRYGEAIFNRFMSESEVIKGLDFSSKEDRYVLARVLVVMGELANEYIMMNECKNLPLFKLLSQIRNDLIHVHSVIAGGIVGDCTAINEMVNQLANMMPNIIEAERAGKLNDTGNLVTELENFKKVLDGGKTQNNIESCIIEFYTSILKEPRVLADYEKRKKNLEKFNVDLAKKQETYRTFRGGLVNGTSYPQELTIVTVDEIKQLFEKVKDEDRKGALIGLISYVSTFKKKFEENSQRQQEVNDFEDRRNALKVQYKKFHGELSEHDTRKKKYTEGLLEQPDSIKLKALTQDILESRISAEMEYLRSVQANSSLTAQQRDYIIHHIISVLGQSFSDFTKSDPNIEGLMSNTLYSAIHNSEQARNQGLAHNIFTLNENILAKRIRYEILPAQPDYNAVYTIRNNQLTSRGLAPMLYKAIGQSYARLGLYKKAMEYFELALKDIKDNPQIEGSINPRTKVDQYKLDEIGVTQPTAICVDMVYEVFGMDSYELSILSDIVTTAAISDDSSLIMKTFNSLRGQLEEMAQKAREYKKMLTSKILPSEIAMSTNPIIVKFREVAARVNSVKAPFVINQPDDQVILEEICSVFSSMGYAMFKLGYYEEAGGVYAEITGDVRGGNDIAGSRQTHEAAVLNFIECAIKVGGIDAAKKILTMQQWNNPISKFIAGIAQAEIDQESNPSLDTTSQIKELDNLLAVNKDIFITGYGDLFFNYQLRLYILKIKNCVLQSQTAQMDVYSGEVESLINDRRYNRHALMVKSFYSIAAQVFAVLSSSTNDSVSSLERLKKAENCYEKGMTSDRSSALAAKYIAIGYEYYSNDFDDKGYTEEVDYYNNQYLEQHSQLGKAMGEIEKEISRRDATHVKNNELRDFRKDLFSAYEKSLKGKNPTNQWNFYIQTDKTATEFKSVLQGALGCKDIDCETSENKTLYIELTSKAAVDAMKALKSLF